MGIPGFAPETTHGTLSPDSLREIIFLNPRPCFAICFSEENVEGEWEDPRNKCSLAGSKVGAMVEI